MESLYNEISKALVKKILRGHTMKDICGYGLEESVLVKMWPSINYILST